MDDPFVPVRAVHLAATMLVTGTVLFDSLVGHPALVGEAPALTRLRIRSRLLLAGGIVLALLSGVTWFALLAGQIGGAAFGETAWTLATDTQFGTVWTLRLALALLMAGHVAWPDRRVRMPQWRQGILVTCGGAFTATLSWSGHGAATPGAAGDLHLAADALHALAAAAWLGGLLPLVLLLARDCNCQDVALSSLVSAVHRFSFVGVVAVGALIVSGVVNTLFMIDNLELLWRDSYGRALLLKLVLFAGMLILAVRNRQTLTPLLAASAADPGQRVRASRWLVQHSIGELALGLVILLIVAWLGITVPGTNATHMH